MPHLILVLNSNLADTVVTEKYSKSNIENLLRILDKKLKRRADVLLIGGSALSMLGIKEFSKDIDICYSNCSRKQFESAKKRSSEEIGINPDDVQCFQGFDIVSAYAHKVAENSVSYSKLKLTNLRLRIMNPADVAFIKLYLSRERDIADIDSILDKGKMTLSDLELRFHEFISGEKDGPTRLNFLAKFNNYVRHYKNRKNRD